MCGNDMCVGSLHCKHHYKERQIQELCKRHGKYSCNVRRVSTNHWKHHDKKDRCRISANIMDNIVAINKTIGYDKPTLSSLLLVKEK